MLDHRPPMWMRLFTKPLMSQFVTRRASEIAVVVHDTVRLLELVPSVGHDIYVDVKSCLFARSLVSSLLGRCPD